MSLMQSKTNSETNQQLRAMKIAKSLLTKEIKIESMAVEEIKAEMQAIVPIGQSDLNNVIPELLKLYVICLNKKRAIYKVAT